MADHRPNPLDSDRPASEALHTGVKKALLVGVSQNAAGWRPLPAASRDAEGLHQLLQNPDIATFDQVKLLMNPERQRLEEEIYAIAADSQPSDRLVLYFSGHGAQDEDGKLYLTTAISRCDEQGDLIKPTAVALSSIREILNDSVAQQVVILDACFTNTADSSTAVHPLDIQAQLGGSHRLVLTATDSTAYTSEQKQGMFSLYTGYLIEGIQTGTAKRSEAGQVTAAALHRYAQRKVQAAAPAIAPALYAPRSDFDVSLTSAPLPDARLSYRQDVEDRSQGGQTEISEFDRLILNWRRDRLGLSPETTSKIEADVLKPYQERQQKLQRYQDKLQEILSLEYPLREPTLKALERLRQRLGLGQEQTEAIVTQAIAPHDKQYRQNLMLYARHLAREVESGYPLSSSIRNELRYLEAQLKLQPEDVAAIHQQIVTQRQAQSPALLRNNDIAQRSGGQLTPDPFAQIPLADGLAAEGDGADDYSQHLQQYEQFFLSKYQPNQPLDDQTLDELSSLQKVLHLKEADAAQIEAAAAQQKLSDYRQNLQHYEQEFARTAQTEPLDNPFTRSRLQQLQQELSLSPADVEQVEKVVLALMDTDDVAIAAPPVSSATGDRSAAEGDYRPVALRSVPDLPADLPLALQSEGEAVPSEAPSEAASAGRPAVEVVTLPPGEPLPADPAADASVDRAAVGGAQTVIQSDQPSSDRALPPPPLTRQRTRSLQERLQDPETLAAIGLQALKAALLAVGAILLGRLLIALMMRIMPIEMAQILGVAVFALSIILAWKALERIKLPD